jgi:ribonucleotide reductase alpha subunit
LTQNLTDKYKFNIWLFKSKDKINPFLYTCSKEFIIGYISSLFSADGSVQKSDCNSSYNLQLSNINYNLLIQISNILLLFGIKSSIGIAKEAGEIKFQNSDKIYQTKTCYRLTITGLENIALFNHYIKLVADIKNNKVEEICNIIPKHEQKCKTYTNIIKIEHLGIKDVGCINVGTSHKFTMNSIISGNSELPLPELDSCRLLLINLFSFVVNPFTPEAYFDYKLFYKISQIAQRLMDDIIDLELECINRIIKKIEADPEKLELKERELSLWNKIYEKCLKGRRTGTGTTALADTLAALNIKYGSIEGINITDRIFKCLKFGCYRSSINIAQELGSFPIWNAELEKNNPFLNRIKNEELWLEPSNTTDPGFISGRVLYEDMQK